MEEQRAEKSYVEPNGEPHEAELREASLVQALAVHLRGPGHQVRHLQSVPKDEYQPLFTDLYHETQAC